METTIQKWKGPETEREEVVLREQRAYLHISTTNNGIEGSAAISTNEVSKGVNVGTHIHREDIVEKYKTLSPTPDTPIFDSSTPSSNVTSTQSAPVGIVLQHKEEEQEFYLKKIFVLPPSHGFYCPSCRVCIEKVLVYKRQEEIERQPVDEPAKFETPPEVENPEIDETPGIDDADRIRCSACFQSLVRIGKQFINGLVSRGPEPQPSIVVRIPEAEQPVVPGQGTSKTWEILKSIVYGGLTEILASLSVVTSAASADATTLNIVALAIANLIGGLFVLVHNLRELKAEKPRAREDNQTDEPFQDRYTELLGQKDHFILHAFVAILSFLIFGLVPPIVYGFSFHESDDKDLKLAVVAGASAICITLLAIANAHIRGPNNFVTYFKTVLFYLSTGALAAVLTYVAGALMKKLVEHLGWFESTSNLAFSRSDDIMSIGKPLWGSY